MDTENNYKIHIVTGNKDADAIQLMAKVSNLSLSVVK